MSIINIKNEKLITFLFKEYLFKRLELYGIFIIYLLYLLIKPAFYF